jgi:hypothetical protein
VFFIVNGNTFSGDRLCNFEKQNMPKLVVCYLKYLYYSQYGTGEYKIHHLQHTFHFSASILLTESRILENEMKVS